ncbi:membrane protein insertase YidC [Vulcaniibacterium gelatinicum]|uniref:membrane protein insertase YidC n=1 Tax=Vulcaniibacterium gelatinicum TaxID=2598725 RepID=UPI0011CA3B4C|nr:membrane protein insertase YidC [Vulcaniibacterium gelatinicum]
MNQIRAFLIFAWLMVATLLWLEWSKEQAAPPAAVPGTAQAQAEAVPAGSGAGVPAAPGAQVVPAAPGAVPAPAAAAPAHSVTVTTDVLRLRLDGGSITSAELLDYARTTERGSPPVQLLDARPEHYFVARSGWTASAGPSPGHTGFVPEGGVREVTLAPGATAVEVPFVWQGNGVHIRRVYTIPRGGYAIGVRDEVRNTGTAPWSGYVYRQLLRDPPAAKSGLTNPEAYSLSGAAWYSPEDKYEKRRYEDFLDDGPLDKTVTGGWVALVQHHFLAAWVPQPDQPALYALTVQGRVHGIEARGPRFDVAPGQTVTSQARLWVGPKLAGPMDQVAPGLGLSLDYGVFTFLAKPLHWLLALLERLTGNWGWAIVLLVVLIKLALYPLSAAQYKSMAKMRRFQPRIEQLKERYGDDRQKFQMAMLELYKKEKINPVGGCLPILLQIPVFLALYWVLLESVELRHAAWIPGWINDLTARDPYFVLPVLNVAIMWVTQKLTPAPGMDPMQKKMMQLMPVVFGALMIFFPAGLVLYWVTNGALGLLQQWWMTRRYSEPAAKP